MEVTRDPVSVMSSDVLETSSLTAVQPFDLRHRPAAGSRAFQNNRGILMQGTHLRHVSSGSHFRGREQRGCRRPGNITARLGMKAQFLAIGLGSQVWRVVLCFQKWQQEVRTGHENVACH